MFNPTHQSFLAVEKMATDKLPVTLRDYFFHDPHFFSWDNYEKVKDHVTKISDM